MVSQTSRSDDESDVVPRSIGRVLDLLEIVLDAGECNLTSAAAASGLTPTTALRHLRALEARGYVDRDGAGRFSVGPTMVRIAAAIRELDPLDRLVTAARPHLESLAERTGESTYLAVSDGTVATYVATAESRRAIRHVGWVGQNIPLTGTAVGDALNNPGVIVTRTGAVEPDTTAMSLALVGTGNLGIAVSVIGPAHRLRTRARKQAAGALAEVVARLLRDLGLDTEAEAS